MKYVIFYSILIFFFFSMKTHPQVQEEEDKKWSSPVFSPRDEKTEPNRQPNMHILNTYYEENAARVQHSPEALRDTRRFCDYGKLKEEDFKKLIEGEDITLKQYQAIQSLLERDKKVFKFLNEAVEAYGDVLSDRIQETFNKEEKGSTKTGSKKDKRNKGSKKKSDNSRHRAFLLDAINKAGPELEKVSNYILIQVGKKELGNWNASQQDLIVSILEKMKKIGDASVPMSSLELVDALKMIHSEALKGNKNAQTTWELIQKNLGTRDSSSYISILAEELYKKQNDNDCIELRKTYFQLIEEELSNFFKKNQEQNQNFQKKTEKILADQKKQQTLFENKMLNESQALKNWLAKLKDNQENEKIELQEMNKKVDEIYNALIPTEQEEKNKILVNFISQSSENLQRLISIGEKIGVSSDVLRGGKIIVSAGMLAVQMFLATTPLGYIAAGLAAANFIVSLICPPADIEQIRHDQIMNSLNELYKNQQSIIDNQVIMKKLLCQTYIRQREFRLNMKIAVKELHKTIVGTNEEILNRIEDLHFLTSKIFEMELELKNREYFIPFWQLVKDIEESQEGQETFHQAIKRLNHKPNSVENALECMSNLSALLSLQDGIHPVLLSQSFSKADFLKDCLQTTKLNREEYQKLFYFLANPENSFQDFIARKENTLKIDLTKGDFPKEKHISLSKDEMGKVIDIFKAINIHQNLMKVHLYFDLLDTDQSGGTFFANLNQLEQKYADNLIQNDLLPGYILQESLSKIMELSIAQQRILNGEISILLPWNKVKEYVCSSQIIARNYALQLVWYTSQNDVIQTQTGLEQYRDALAKNELPKIQEMLKPIIDKGFSLCKQENHYVLVYKEENKSSKDPNQKSPAPIVLELPSYDNLKKGSIQYNLALYELCSKYHELKKSVFSYKILNEAVLGVNPNKLYELYSTISNYTLYVIANNQEK